MPLVNQWIVIALGTHCAVALLARDRGDAGPERDGAPAGIEAAPTPAGLPS